MNRFLILLAFLCSFALPSVAGAANTVPQQLVYNGHLLSPSGTPITTPHTVRFSIWNSSDIVTGDISTGNINTLAGTYLDWQEEHTVTPDSSGYFSIDLGSVTPLFSVVSISASDLQSMFLQIEVKGSTEPNTSYEALDIDASNSIRDRSPVLSVPFALNADYLDQREIGTGSGDIALLSDGGVFAPSIIPGGTFSNIFTIDFDNTSATDVTLQFGGTLAKTLKYDQLNSYFAFNDDVHITGDLFVTGLINGVDITSLVAPTSQLRVSSDGPLTVAITAGSYRINGVTTDYAGAAGIAVPDNQTTYVYFTATGLQQSSVGFPSNEAFVRLATVVASAGTITSVTDGRTTLADDRGSQELIRLNPLYPQVSYTSSGIDNVGALAILYEALTDRNYYSWKSSKSTEQTYSVVVSVQLPNDFAGFTATPLRLDYRTSSSTVADAHIDIEVLDTSDTPITLGGSFTNLNSLIWNTANITFGGSPTFTPGESIAIKLTTSSRNSFEAMLATISLEYNRL
jgi:hypothetical protein